MFIIFFGYMNVYRIILLYECLSVYCYMNVYHIFRLYE